MHVIYGKERFLVLDKYKEILEAYRKENAEVETFEFYSSDSDFDFGYVLEAYNTVSLFQTPKSVFFYLEDEKDFNKLDQNALIEMLSNNANDLLVIAFPKKQTKEKKLHAALKKHATEHSLTISKSYNANERFSHYLHKYQVNMTPNAQKVFLDRIGEDYSRMENELEKLALLETLIDEDLVEKMITQDISRDIFALGNALLDKNASEAFRIYHSLLTQRNDPLNLAPLVAASLRTIYQVETLVRRGYSQDMIIDTLKISKGQYWVVSNRQVGKVNNVLSILNTLSDLDQNSKLGNIDRFVAFELFMIEMCQ